MAPHKRVLKYTKCPKKPHLSAELLPGPHKPMGFQRKHLRQTVQLLKRPKRVGRHHRLLNPTVLQNELSSAENTKQS